MGGGAAADEVRLRGTAQLTTRRRARLRTRRLAQSRVGKAYFGENGCLTDPFLAVTSAAVGVPATARSMDSLTAR